MFLALSFSMSTASVLGQGRYLETDEFLDQAFAGQEPMAEVLWVTSELRSLVEGSVGYYLEPLRVRYWQIEARTAWILDEIGKERPITIGIVIEDGSLALVRVLEFRESRGWEVRYPFFTDQFDGVALDESQRLSWHIDSITGATLCVDAVTRVARAALFLHGYVGKASD